MVSGKRFVHVSFKKESNMKTEEERVEDSLRCDCGSESVSLAYSVPLFVTVESGSVRKVVVNDEGAEFSCVVRCLSCDRFWIANQEPDLGDWPGWEFGH